MIIMDADYLALVQARKARAGRGMAIGGLVLFIGLALTVFSYFGESGTHVISWGLMGFGLIRFIISLFGYFNA